MDSVPNSEIKRCALGHFVIVLVCMAALTFSGCVVSRLMTLKNQLHSFSTYFTLTQSTLQFKTPTLFPNDVLFLVRIWPSEKTVTADQETWRYHLVKKSKSVSDQNVETLTFEFLFKQNRLAQVTLPSKLSELFPKPLITMGLSAIGKGEFDAHSKTLNADPGANRKHSVRHYIPTADKVAAVLGPPTKSTVNESVTVLRYAYKPKPAKGYRKSSVVPDPWVEFTFDRKSNQLKQLKGTLFGPMISFEV